MAKAKKSEAVNEDIMIPIVELEQYKLLPKPTQALIKDLSGDLKSSSLTVFNPLVEAMASIEAFKTIKYKEDDDDSIKAFKDAKSAIRSFRASTKEAKSTLKAPFLEIGKKLDTIEKTFIERATKILDELELEFKPYLDEEQRKKEELEARKNAEQTEKIEKLNEESSANAIIIKRMHIKSKYDSFIFGIGRDITSKLQTYSKEALKEELKLILIADLVIPQEEQEYLLREQIDELNQNFASAIHSATQLLEMKISAMENPTTYTPAPTPVYAPMDTPQESLLEVIEDVESIFTPPLSKDDPEWFKINILDIFTDTIESINNLETKTQKEDNVKSQTIASLLTLQGKIDAFL